MEPSLRVRGTVHCRYLQSWADQGVLLLNAVLTVKAHSANSHKDKVRAPILLSSPPSLAQRHGTIYYYFTLLRAVCARAAPVRRDAPPILPPPSVPLSLPFLPLSLHGVFRAGVLLRTCLPACPPAALWAAPHRHYPSRSKMMARVAPDPVVLVPIDRAYLRIWSPARACARACVCACVRACVPMLVHPLSRAPARARLGAIAGAPGVGVLHQRHRRRRE